MSDVGKYYEILGLKPQASLDAVKEAYRDLVKVYHPDLFAHNPKLQVKTQEKLKEINEAYTKIQEFSINHNDCSQAIQPEISQHSRRNDSPQRDKQDSSRLEEARQRYDFLQEEKGHGGQATKSSIHPHKKYAGFWLRAGAFLIDSVFIAVPVIIFDIIARDRGGLFGAFLIYTLFGWLYYTWFEASYLQATLGKRAMGIIVTDYSGQKINFRKASGRYFAKFLSVAVLCIGYIMAGLTRQKQALHDTMAETLVVTKTGFQPSIVFFAFFFATYLFAGTPLYFYYVSYAGHNPLFFWAKLSGFALIPLGFFVAYSVMRTHGKKVSIPSAFVTCLLIVLIVFGTVGGEFYDGNTAKYWYNRGIEYYKSGEQEKAVDAFTLAIRIQPDHVQAHNRLGSVFRDLGRYREAIGAYQRAIRIKPDCADAHFDLGVTYSDVDVHDKAIKEFRETLQIDPEYINVHYNLGISLYKLRHHKEAIEAFKRVIQKQPGSAEARYNLGINYLAENDKNAALVEYNILKNVDPERAQTLLSKIQNETRNTGMVHYNDLKD